MATAAWDLCTVADVHTALETTSTARDGVIQDYISDASLEIIGYCQREFAPATSSEKRRFRVDPRSIVDGCVRIDLFPYDLRTVATMTLNPEDSSPSMLVANTDYVLLPIQPFDGLLGGTPVEPSYSVHTHVQFSGWRIFNSAVMIRFGFCYIDITGAWGFPSVPGDVNQACVQTVVSWLRRDFPQFAQAGFDAEGQTLQPPAAGTYSLPSSALRKLARFKRHGGVF